MKLAIFYAPPFHGQEPSNLCYTVIEWVFRRSIKANRTTVAN